MTAALQGLIAFPVTPTDSDGRFDSESFRRLLERLIDSGVHGLAVLGSTGAAAYFSEAERRDIAAAAAQIIRKRVPLLVGTGAITTAEAVRLSRHAQDDVGADAVLVVPASYWPLTTEEIYRHYETIASSVAIPVGIYNNPRTTQVDIGPELARRLCALPNVKAFKETSIDIGRVRQLIEATGGELAVGYARDATAFEALVAGAHAWHSGIANVIPRECVSLFELVKQAGDYAAASKIAARIAPLCRFASEKGLIRSVHTALDILGIGVGAPRRPLGLLEGADLQALEKHLVALNLV